MLGFMGVLDVVLDNKSISVLVSVIASVIAVAGWLQYSYTVCIFNV